MPVVPMIHQTAPNGCAWACVRMILCFYNLDPSLYLAITPKKITDGLKKVSIRELSSLFSLHGLTARSWWLYDDELKNLTLPSIILLGKNHYAILVEINDRFSLVKDPRRGYLRISKNTFSNLFGNIALEIYPTKSWTPS